MLLSVAASLTSELAYNALAVYAHEINHNDTQIDNLKKSVIQHYDVQHNDIMVSF